MTAPKAAGLLLVSQQLWWGWRQGHVVHGGSGLRSGHPCRGEGAVPGDGFPLQRPVEVCQESRLNAKAGLG